MSGNAYDRAAHRAAVEAGYAPLDDYVARNPLPHGVPIRHDIFTRFKEIADAKNTTPATVINQALRDWLGEH